MRYNYYHIILVLLFCIASCKKDTTDAQVDHASLLKVLPVNSSYTARDVVAFPDGSMVISGVQLFDKIVDAFAIPATPLPAMMAKYAADGLLQWQIELPEVVQVLWHCKLHSSGNIIVVGVNSQPNSQQIGIVIISPLGKVLAQNSFFNASNVFTQNGYGINGADCVELPNGNIAVAMPSHQGGSFPLMVRLVIFNLSLAKIVDEFYGPGVIPKTRPVSQVCIRIDAAGDILINGIDNGYNNDTLNYFAFMLKLKGTDYSIMYQQVFNNPTTSTPSNFAISNTGSTVWASTNSYAEDTLNEKWFSMRLQEVYYVGPRVSIWKSDGNNANTIRMDFSGFSQNGYISKIIKCSEGGYVLFGTCNINTNQQVPSEYQLMLIKVSESLQVEWMQFPNTNSQSVAGDILETSTGYLLSATHLSLGEISSPILFKTDKRGTIK